MKEIRVGDLVCVVRGHICDLGMTGVVTEICTAHGWSCACGTQSDEKGPLAILDCNKPWQGEMLAWLIRIDPPGLTEESKEELSA